MKIGTGLALSSFFASAAVIAVFAQPAIVEKLLSGMGVLIVVAMFVL